MMRASDKDKPSKTIYDDLSLRTGELYKRAQSEAQLAKSPTSGYQPIESEYPGIKKFQKAEKNGRIHEIWIDERYNTVTYQLTGNQDDKNKGLVGTDGKAVVKMIGDKGYDYLKVDDFIDRATMLFKAAHLAISKFPEPVKSDLQQWLTKQQARVIKEIVDNANFDGIKDKVRMNDEVFKQKFEAASAILKRTIVDIAEGIRIGNDAAAQTPKSRSEVINELKQAEIQYITEQGRPFVVKVGNILGERPFVSTQFPHGKKTIPSSDRTGKHDIKLSNHVRDGSGIVNPDGSITIKSIVDGHSSYPPIGEKDEMIKRYIAYQAVQEKILQLATDLINANPNTPKPLTISLSTMMMLTPALGKSERFIRKNESEHGQLADTRYGIEMLANSDQPIILKINGKDIPVNVDISYMNLPVNLGKAGQLLTSPKLQDNINAKGFNELSKKMLNHLSQIEAENSSPLIKSEIEELKKYYQRTNIDGITEKEAMLANKEKKLADAKKSAANELKKHYADLKVVLQKHMDAPEDKEIKAAYNKIRGKIRKLEEPINTLNKDIDDLKSSIYQSKGAVTVRVKLIRQINDKLKDKSVQNDPVAKKILISHLHFLRAEDLYYNKKYLNTRNAYQFHVNFLLASEGIGRSIEAFCKSAEDRTGWLRVSMLANMAFSQANGHPPNLDDPTERKTYNQFVSAAALELSASLENTKYNSEARSLQVKGKFTNEDYNIDSGKAVSTLAKAIYNELPSEPKVLFTPPSAALKAAPSPQRHIRTVTVTRKPTPAITATTGMPAKIDPKDIHADSGALLSKDHIEILKEAVKDGLINIKQPGRYTKKQLKALLDADLPLNIMVLPNPDGTCRMFAVYKGIKKDKHMAEGGMSTLKYAQDLDSKEFVAVKLQKHVTPSQKKDQAEEMVFQARAGQMHGNIIYERELSPSSPKQPGRTKGAKEVNAIIMPIIKGSEPTIASTEKMPPEKALDMALAAIEAVNELHDKHKILHCDIKPENMIYDPVKNKMQLIDFGRSLFIDKSDTISDMGIRGTPIYMEPELRKLVYYNQNIDKNIGLLEDALTKKHEQLSKMQNSTPPADIQAIEKVNASIKEFENQLEKSNNLRERLSKVEFKYTQATDVYSLGITIAKLLGLSVQTMPAPGSKDTPHYTIQASAADKPNLIIANEKILNKMISLLKQMTDNDPATRPKLTSAMDQFKQIMVEFKAAPIREKSLVREIKLPADLEIIPDTPKPKA